MEKEKYFYQYNLDNLGCNLYASEVHARSLKGEMQQEHASCIFKHLALIQDALSELQSHCLSVNPSQLSDITFLHDETRKARELLKETREPSYIISAIRDLKKLAEKLDPTLKLEDCQVCGEEKNNAQNAQSKSINAQEFEGYSLVMLTKDGCPHCEKMLPIIQELKGLIVKPTEDQKKKYNLTASPAYLVIKEGKLVGSFKGAMSKEELLNKIANPKIDNPNAGIMFELTKNQANIILKAIDEMKITGKQAQDIIDIKTSFTKGIEK